MHVCIISFFFFIIRRPPISTLIDDLFPYATRFRSVRRYAPDRREGVLAPGPETHALGFVLGQAHFGGTGQLQHFADSRTVVMHVSFDAVEFAEQNRDRKSTRLNSSH